MINQKIIKNLLDTYLIGEYGDVGITLASIFNYISSENIDLSTTDEYLSLIQFAKKRDVFIQISLKNKEKELHNCYVLLENLIIELQNKNKRNRRYKLYQQEIEWEKDKKIEEEKRFGQLDIFYLMILNNWNLLKDWNSTYKLLSELSLLEQGYRNTPEDKSELLEIIRKIKWNYK